MLDKKSDIEGALFVMEKYSLETKLKAVNDVVKLGMSPGSVAKLLNTSRSLIQAWVTRYETFGTDGFSMKPDSYW